MNVGQKLREKVDWKNVSQLGRCFLSEVAIQACYEEKKLSWINERTNDWMLMMVTKCTKICARLNKLLLYYFLLSFFFSFCTLYFFTISVSVSLIVTFLMILSITIGSYLLFFFVFTMALCYYISLFVHKSTTILFSSLL